MRRTTRYSLVLMTVALATALLAVACEVWSAPANLDRSFSDDGKLTTDFGQQEAVHAMSVQQNGKVVVAGYTQYPLAYPLNNDFALVRYNTDGSPDSTFSNNGRLTTDLGSNTVDLANDLVLQPDGKILVAGRASGDFALARYKPNGDLDASFDGDGKFVLDVAGGGYYDEAFALALLPDGKLVAAGSADNSEATDDPNASDFALVRFNPNGSLDDTFGGDGKLTTDMGNREDAIYDLAIDSDGKLVVAGYTRNTETGEDAPALARYNAKGSLDTSFGGDGKVIGGAYESSAHALVLQPDGKVVTVGHSFDYDGNYDFALTRYNSDGSIDRAFGAGGKAFTNFGASEQSSTLALQENGKLLTAGYSTEADDEGDFALARYTTDGKLDTSFSEDGKLTTSVGRSSEDIAQAMALQLFDGKILLAGRSDRDFALARYRGGDKEIGSIDGGQLMDILAERVRSLTNRGS